MKNNSRGNYKVLYRELEPDQLYSHFTVVEQQAALLDAHGLDAKKALKAAREMARVHFAELEPDGLIANKKAWYGHRWTGLYQQWGDYLSERELQDPEQELAQLLVKPEATSEDHQKKTHVYLLHLWINRLLSQRRASLKLAAILLIFVTGFMTSKVLDSFASRPVADANMSPGMLMDDGTQTYRPWVLSKENGKKLLYFPNLEGTLAVFRSRGESFAIVDGKMIEVGDHLILDDNRGRVSEIHPARLTMIIESGTVQFPFPTHMMFGQETFGIGNIVIYPEHGNLMPILRSICKVGGLKLTGSPSRHTISGRFESVESFLNACGYFGITIDHGQLVVPEATVPKSYVSYEGLWSQPAGTLKQLINYYGPHLAYQQVTAEDISSRKRWVLNYGLQFEEFCEFFKLTTEPRGNHLIVEGGKNGTGEAGD